VIRCVPSLFPLLALHSGSEYKVHSQLPNGSVGQGRDGQSGVVVIPTIDGETPLANYEGARVHLSDLEVRLSYEPVSEKSGFQAL
jgi:hypothetical protein